MSYTAASTNCILFALVFLLQSPRHRMPPHQQSPSGVSNVSPVLAAISMDDSRMSSITETLVTANEHPEMFPVDGVTAPAPLPVPVPTAAAAQSTDPYWVVAVDPTSRRLFYHDVNSGASSWVPPPGASVSIVPPPLAPTASSPPRAILDQASVISDSITPSAIAPVLTELKPIAEKSASRHVRIDAQPQASEPPSSTKNHRRKHSKSKKSVSRKHRSHRSSSRNHRHRDASTSSYSETASSSTRSRSGTAAIVLTGTARGTQAT